MKRMTFTATCSLDSMMLYTTSRIVVVFVRVSDLILLVFKENLKACFC